MKKKNFKMIDYPDRLQTENDNWLCQSDRLPDYDLQWTRDYTTTILETVTLDWDFTMLKLCHGIGPIWYKKEEDLSILLWHDKT